MMHFNSFFYSLFVVSNLIILDHTVIYQIISINFEFVRERITGYIHRNTISMA